MTYGSVIDMIKKTNLGKSFCISARGLEIVAYENQLADIAAKHGDWESSGIIDASSFYGKGYWLLDMQAHSLQEGGQLLLMKVDGS
jgi:hypothetical protein